MFIKRRLVVVAVVLSIAGIVSIAPETGSLAAPSYSVAITRTVAFEPRMSRATPSEQSPDAELIGKVLGSSTAVGSAWQNAQAAMSPFVEDLAEAAGQRFVGQFVLRSDSYSAVVRATSGAPIADLESLARRLADEVGVPITIQYVDAPPYSAMLAELDKVSMILSQHGYSVESWIDDVTTQIVFAPESGVTTKAQVETVAASVLGSTPFRVENPRPGQEQMLTGGARLRRASDSAPICTIGFPVNSINSPSVRGLSTAAHCGTADRAYTSPSQSTPLALSFQGGKYNGSSDMYWWRRFGSGSTVVPKFWYDAGASSSRTITGIRTRGGMQLNHIYCAYGRKTDEEVCGFLLSKTSTSAGCGAYTCDHVWLTLGDSPYMHCEHGDSGGPMFDGSRAAGILSSGSITHDLCTYMSISYFSLSGLEVYDG